LKDEQSISGGKLGVVEYLPLSAREAVPTKMSLTGKEGGKSRFTLWCGVQSWPWYHSMEGSFIAGGNMSGRGCPILNGGWLLQQKNAK